MGLPNQQSMQEFIDEKPLIVGAVGLGLGIALGAMMPMTSAPTKRSARKSSRRK
jgi:ABC-type lipoprotein release transport system permease subunit